MNDFSARPADFSELLLRLYRLSQELPIALFQDAALAQIKLVLPFDSSMWGTATTTDHGIDIHTVHLYEQPAEMLTAYEAVKHQDTAAASLVGLPRVTGRFHLPTWLDRPGTQEALEVSRRFQMQNIFISVESQPHLNFVHWITLFRADKEAHCTEDERSLMSQLAPHVMQALAMNRMIHLERLEQADHALSPHGAAIADTRGTVYHADPQFRALAEAEWSEWTGVALPADFMSDLVRGTEKFIGRSIVMRPHVEHGLLFLKARPRCRADLLSPREHTVAHRIAKGESHKEIARALGNSPATVRNQVQSIYAKLQVNSIATLVEALRQAE